MAGTSTDLPRTCATVVFEGSTGGPVWSRKSHGPATDLCRSGICREHWWSSMWQQEARTCHGPVPQWYSKRALADLCGAGRGTDLPRTCATVVFAERIGGLVWSSKSHGPATDLCHSGICIALAVLYVAARATDLPRTCATVVLAELIGGRVWGTKSHGPVTDLCHSCI